ncbi:MAG TPA: sialidase family protein, partial [Gemmatimonadaceae bacterium]|nr:sialidase family protein [Gemmatimonadaceae bacterium]
GALESISASAVSAGVIWAGSNNGLLHVTRDHGATWRDVTPPSLPLPAVAGLVAVEASRHNPAEAYVAISYHTRGDYAPYIYRTRDYGQTWTKIVNGLPAALTSGAFVRVVREDTKRAGLLFAGTESGVYVSFDDGDSWQSLQLNLPNTSYRDITVHDNDLVAGTYGRGIWVLDDMSPLRQMSAGVMAEAVHLFKPGDAVRLRRNVGSDTPFPAEVPHALNAPTGMFVYYALGQAPSQPVMLDVLDAAGHVVRHLTSAPQPPVREAAQPPEPNFWIAPPYSIPASAGLNRAVWDLRYDPPPAFTHSFEINANPGLTPASPEGALALPGVYTLRLTVDERTYQQTGVVRPDPRSPATLAQLAAQHGLLMRLTGGIDATWNDFQPVAALKHAVEAAKAGAPDPIVSAANALAAKIDSVAGEPNARRGFGGRNAQPTFVSVNAEFVNQLNAQDNGDMAPTPAASAAAASACHDLAGVVTRWNTLVSGDLAALDAMLSRQGLATIAAPAAARGCVQ